MMIALMLVCYWFFLLLICIPVFIIAFIVELIRIRKKSRKYDSAMERIIAMAEQESE